MAPPDAPAHSKIVEVNIISADDLAHVSRNMKTYAMVFVNPEEKVATGVDDTGGNHPIWNDKFNFRVDDKFLNSEDAAINMEIYAAAWMKDALIGYVNVLIKDIFHMRSTADDKAKHTTTRTVALQVHRPSGRPQGILNVKVTLIDPSVPPLAGANAKATHETKEISDGDHENKNDQPNAKINRSGSHRTNLSMDDPMDKGANDFGSMVNGESDPDAKCNGSMVNGESLCNSDVGPSASVVAAAIAKGLYIPPVQPQVHTVETKKIREWTKKEMRSESLDMKLDRWKTELAQPLSVGYRQGNSTKGKKSKGNRPNDGTKLFSCFGNAFGCEISITCGGGSKKKHGNGNGNGNGNNKICHLSSVDDNYSQSML